MDTWVLDNLVNNKIFMGITAAEKLKNYVM